MILFAFLAAVSLAAMPQAGLQVPLQATGLDATPEIYQAPTVRPFEPPSDFGREAEAEGDAGGDRRRGPLIRPVAVDAYVGDYEVTPSDGEAAYDQGVAQAEIDADRRAGPLDGRWRVAAPDGRPLLSLALTDRGEGRRVEGAWRRLDERAAPVPGGPQVQPLSWARPRSCPWRAANCTFARPLRAGAASWSRTAAPARSRSRVPADQAAA